MCSENSNSMSTNTKNVFCIEAEKIRGIPNENPISNPNRMDYVIRKYMSSTM